MLRETFADERVLLNLDAHDLGGVINAAVGLLVGDGLVAAAEAGRVEQALLDREAQASTAIGHAVAVPHAYHSAVLKPVIVFVRTRSPLNLGAPDGIPTRFFFFLVGPEEATSHHLDALAGVARLMADDEFRYEARHAANGAELVEALSRFTERTAPAAAPPAEEPHPTPAGLRWTGRFLGGVFEDAARRAPRYASDLIDGLHPKCLASTLLLFFACLAPAIIFGGLMAAGTGADPAAGRPGAIGPVEMLIATAVCGVAYALLSGQPLIILGGTGPLLVITTILYRLCGDAGLDFLSTYAWVGLWAGLLTVVLAATDASVLIRYFTRFTDEVFSALISLIFIYDAVQNLAGAFLGVGDGGSYEAALLSLLLAVGTFYIAMSLSQARRSSFLRPWMREFLADFGPTIAMAVMAAVALSLSRVPLDRLPAPAEFGPSIDRPWLIDLGAAPLWVKLGAVGPGALVALLVFLDQNITGRLVNSPDHRLQKGPGYHLDLAVVGGLIGLCSLFGLPWLVAATVRSLNHVRSLATTEEVVTAGGRSRERIVHVRENRVTGLAIHLLIGASLLLLPYLGVLPMAVLYGLFLFMGVVSIAGNQFFERLSLWVKDPDLYPVTHYMRRAPTGVIHLFTGIQLACLVVLWLVKSSDEPQIAILFPLLIALLAPIRMAAGLWFQPEHLAALDAEEEPDEEETHYSG